MMAAALRPRRTLIAMAAVVVAGALLGASIPGAQASPASPRQDGGEPRVRDLIYRWRDLDNSERVEQGAEQTTVTLADEVLFEFDRADLRPAAATQLDELAGALRELGPRTVTIVGHTDNRGEPAYNQDLSERRAESVRAALAERLGDEFTFEVSGAGETRPVAANENEDGSDNPEGRALNRRVEVTYAS
jgi:outer membrane protein OmpA-like peptidoglycan-associated protein